MSFTLLADGVSDLDIAQISRSRLAAELWRRHKTELRSVKPNRRSEDSEEGSREDGLATPCRREERRDCTTEQNMSNGADVLGEWESLHTPPPVARALRELGFTTPTAIQREAIPPAIVEKCDIIGAAETVCNFFRALISYLCQLKKICLFQGSGKTLAFAIPILHYILNHCKPVEGSEERRRRRRVRDMGGEGRRIVDLNVVIHGGKKEIEEEEEEEEEDDEEEEEEEEGGQEEEELDSEDLSDLEESGFELMEEQSGGEGEGDVSGGVGLVGYRDNISDDDFEKMLAGTLSPWGEVDQSHDSAGGSHDHGDITSISHDPTLGKHVGYNGKLIALVLTPTRELALQVHSHITAAVKYTSIKVTHNGYPHCTSYHKHLVNHKVLILDVVTLLLLPHTGVCGGGWYGSGEAGTVTEATTSNRRGHTRTTVETHARGWPFLTDIGYIE